MLLPFPASRPRGRSHATCWRVTFSQTWPASSAAATFKPSSLSGSCVTSPSGPHVHLCLQLSLLLVDGLMLGLKLAHLLVLVQGHYMHIRTDWKSFRFVLFKIANDLYIFMCYIFMCLLTRQSPRKCCEPRQWVDR